MWGGEGEANTETERQTNKDLYLLVHLDVEAVRHLVVLRRTGSDGEIRTRKSATFDHERRANRRTCYTKLTVFNATFQDKAWPFSFAQASAPPGNSLPKQRHFIKTATANQVLLNDARVAL